ncbi:Methyl-accepting chemotaxis protein McpH [Thermoflexales bacterium]|nr:Methyl-accepting chemotaxis protein McpH [Thermoflexales bacterium]
MANRDELQNRLEELFSPPPQTKPATPPAEPEAPDLPGGALSADDQTLSVSAMASSATEEPARFVSSPAIQASETAEKVTDTAEPITVSGGQSSGSPDRPARQIDLVSQQPGVESRSPKLFSSSLETASPANASFFWRHAVSLRLRLSFMVLLAMLAVFFVVAAATQFQARDVLTQTAKEKLESNTTAVLDNVQTWLDLNVKALQALASQPAIVSMDPQQQKPYLENMARAFTDMYLVSTTDLNGLNVARSDQEAAKEYQSREWFQGPRNGEPLTVQIVIGQTSNRPALVAGVPILQEQRLVGVAMFASELPSIVKAVNANRLGESGQVYVIDSQNRPVAVVDPAVPQDKIDPLSEKLPVQALRAGIRGLYIYDDENGVRWHAQLATLPNDWGIIVQQQESEFLRPLLGFRNVTLFVFGLGVVILAILMWVAVGRALRPVQELAGLARIAAAGDLNVTAPVKRPDEVGVLAQAFNLMIERLRELIGGLEQRVAARSQDLTLAAEVGRSVSNVREINTLLTNAVDLIRERFDLYYTQIYLTDAVGRRLVLRAGTGPVGHELLQRGHRLPIGPGSINGTVAAEKRVVIVSDTTRSDTFRPNPLLPDTRSEMAVPLLAGDRVVGVLDLQSAQPGALTPDNVTAFEALAGQLAIAIENATLFTEAEQARAEVEAQARRLTQAGWHEFLDAVQRSERLGYTYDQQTLTPLTEPLSAAPAPTVLDAPILLLGQPIGHIQLEQDADVARPWTSADLELVSNIATRVASQVENLRLLSQAEQYRAEAETAMRRLTREGWDDLRTRGELAPGYVYDLNEVKPLSEKSNGASAETLKQPFAVRDETIGELEVDVEANFDEAAEIIAAVAKQLSGHLETLRLSELNEKRAQREQALRQITSALRSSTDPAMIMRIAVRELGGVLGRKTVIQMTASEQVNPAESVQGRENKTDSPAGQS